MPIIVHCFDNTANDELTLEKKQNSTNHYNLFPKTFHCPIPQLLRIPVSALYVIYMAVIHNDLAQIQNKDVTSKH